MIRSQFEFFFTDGNFNIKLLMDYVFFVCCFDGKPNIAIQLVRHYKNDTGFNESHTNKDFNFEIITQIIKFSINYCLTNGNQLFWNQTILGNSYQDSIERKSWKTSIKSNGFFDKEKSCCIDYQGTLELINYLKKYKGIFKKQLDIRMNFYNYLLNENKPNAIKLFNYIEEFEKNDKNIEDLFSTITKATRTRFITIFILHICYQEHLRLNHVNAKNLMEKIKNFGKLQDFSDNKFSGLMIDSDGVVMQISGELQEMHKVLYISSNCNAMFGYTTSEIISLEQILPKPFVNFHHINLEVNIDSGAFFNQNCMRKTYYKHKSGNLRLGE